MIWKIQQAMQDDAIRTARIHPAVHPGNRDEVFIWQKFPARLPRSRKPSQPALSYEHIGKARSRKPGQPGRPGSFEEAISECFWPTLFQTTQISRRINKLSDNLTSLSIFSLNIKPFLWKYHTLPTLFWAALILLRSKPRKCLIAMTSLLTWTERRLLRLFCKL